MSSADSPGRSTPKTDPVVIFDFDGTIISVNSFHYWVTVMFMDRFGGLSWPKRMMLSLRTVKIILDRKLRGTSHFQTKQALQALWSEAVKNDEEKIAVLGLRNTLGGKIRKNMRAMLALVTQGKIDAIFATAAASVYARDFAETVGFRHIIATEPDGTENYKEEKRRRVMALISEKGWGDRKRIFFTDHEEDLPLMKESQLVLWFGEDADVASLKEHAPQAEIIACRSRPGDEIASLLLPA